nr:FAD-binding oxidoreductase [Pseudooceanicola aestuarii]
MNPADAALADRLRPQLEPASFREVAPRYLEEPRGAWHGQAGLVLAPGSTAEVSAILAAANDARVPVIPYGGGTGLVGGQVMPDGPAPLVLSMERMAAIREVSPRDNVMVAEAGAILADLHSAAEAHDRLFPLSIAAHGTARIGGNLATNAGGVNVLRYGNTRDLCLGIEAVLADGRVMNTLTRLRKDNTGYDLRNLLIGSEGTLGVITAAALKLFPRPARTGTALMVVPSPEAALDLLAHSRDIAGETISAFELIAGTGLDFLAETMPQVRRPFDPAPDWLVLVELGTGADQDPDALLETIFTAALEGGLVADGLIAQSRGQATEFWNLREMLPEANRLIGAVASHDVSLPMAVIPEFIARGRALGAEFGDLRLNCFGHLGDGNLHFNFFPPRGTAKATLAHLKAPVMRAVHDLVHEYRGSVSAEHGIGRLKVDDMRRYGDPVRLEMMYGIKQVFDPNGILNPGAVLPPR